MIDKVGPEFNSGMIEPGSDGESDKINSDNVIEVDSNEAMIIGLARLYDLMLVIAQKVNPEDTEQMLRLHSDGKLYGPPPFWVE